MNESGCYKIQEEPALAWFSAATEFRNKIATIIAGNLATSDKNKEQALALAKQKCSASLSQVFFVYVTEEGCEVISADTDNDDIDDEEELFIGTDVANASRGEWFMAGMSAAGVVAGAGDFAKTSSKIAEFIAKNVDKTDEIACFLVKLSEKYPEIVAMVVAGTSTVSVATFNMRTAKVSVVVMWVNFFQRMIKLMK